MSLARCQFVVGALAYQQRPRAALAPTQKGPAVAALSITVMVVAQPAGTFRRFHLQNVIDHLQRVHDQGIVGRAHPVADQFQKAGIDDLACFEISLLARAQCC